MKSYAFYESPVGRLLLEDNGRALLRLVFAAPDEDVPVAKALNPLQEQVTGALDRYFSGELFQFDLPLAPAGTPFQRKVWETLTTIRYGETRSYRQVANRIGRPKAARAVGLASGQNPIAIIIPCHRVVGSDGSLTGYAGGLENKEKLLLLEQRMLATARGPRI